MPKTSQKPVLPLENIPDSSFDIIAALELVQSLRRKGQSEVALSLERLLATNPDISFATLQFLVEDLSHDHSPAARHFLAILIARLKLTLSCALKAPEKFVDLCLAVKDYPLTVALIIFSFRKANLSPSQLQSLADNPAVLPEISRIASDLLRTIEHSSASSSLPPAS